MHRRGWRLVTVCLLALSVSACGGGTIFGLTSFEATSLSPPAAHQVARDIVAKFSEQVEPKNTTIRVAGSGGFRSALESEFRNWGFAVANANADRATVPVSYVIDDLAGRVLLRLSTPRFELARIYVVNGASGAPDSPVTIIQRS